MCVYMYMYISLVAAVSTHTLASYPGRVAWENGSIYMYIYVAWNTCTSHGLFTMLSVGLYMYGRLTATTSSFYHYFVSFVVSYEFPYVMHKPTYFNIKVDVDKL